MLGIDQYFHYVLSAQSDSMLVAVCLAAIDCHLNGRHRWAWWLLALASLGRPEVWPFAGLYAIWAWLKVPAMRWMLYRGTIGERVPVVRGSRRSPTTAPTSPASWRSSPRASCTATRSSARSTASPALDYLPLELAALLAVVLAVLRRNRVVLVARRRRLCSGCVVEIAFALHGFPGVPALSVRARRR